MGLVIKHLNVTIGSKAILHDYNLEIKPGEIHAIMGPNGCGKSTLAKVIMGSKDYTITGGEINYQGEDLQSLAVETRAQRGIFLAMQNPIAIEGVTNLDFMRTACRAQNEQGFELTNFLKTVEQALKQLEMDPNLFYRAVNTGFSGGEQKKNEILQMQLLRPKLIMLDEIDSGLDIDSLKIVAQNIKHYCLENKDTSVLIITHYPRILKYLKPDYVHIMTCGKIVKSGPYELSLTIENEGYNGVKHE